MELEKPFETTYMQALFELGYQMSEKGHPWAKQPPGYRALGAGPTLAPTEPATESRGTGPHKEPEQGGGSLQNFQGTAIELPPRRQGERQYQGKDNEVVRVRPRCRGGRSLRPLRQ